MSFTKGCYIGQEIVSRVRSVGHVNRTLRGLRATDASPLYAGMNLYAAGDARAARPWGGSPARRRPPGTAARSTWRWVSCGATGSEVGTTLEAVLPPEGTAGEKLSCWTKPRRRPAGSKFAALPFI